MSTTAPTPTLTYSALATLPDSYFKSVDARNIDAILHHFTPTATLTIQSNQGLTHQGEAEIRSMFTAFVSNSKTMSHEIKSVVVDVVGRRIATEQRYIGEMLDGTRNDMHNCNFFDVDEHGRFTRVVIWMEGVNPLK
ncbi:hypothetical protein TCE0_018f05794 [Talaromyces pinophilus]|uniref:SnoaL-like domain-containing protein n=1 Tax=Talaromyces pinophilus TaxID=128442 RepID=A0A510NWF2_TALPI|nr:hypothetical protein TCE0_018f05794 [Talaromyces pinophilus]